MESLVTLSPATSTALNKILDSDLPRILRVQGEIVRATHDFMHARNVIMAQPLLLAPTSEDSTAEPSDPRLVDGRIVPEKIRYGNQTFALMKSKSKIVHKQLLLANPGLDAIYIVYPDVRLEAKEHGNDGRHLFEFTIIDFEFKNVGYFYVMKFTEDLVIHILKHVNNSCHDDIAALRGDMIPIPTTFQHYWYDQLEDKLGAEAEEKASAAAVEPFWLLRPSFPHEQELFHNADAESITGHRRLVPLGHVDVAAKSYPLLAFPN